MKLQLLFDNLEPITLNTQGRFGKGRFYKTDKTQKFISQVNLMMRQYKNDLNKFNKYYDETKHFLVCDYYFYKPIITKKDKRISKTSGDLSNLVKALEDAIFKHLHADDSAVCVLNVHKINSQNIYTKVNIQVRDLSYVNF